MNYLPFIEKRLAVCKTFFMRHQNYIYLSINIALFCFLFLFVFLPRYFSYQESRTNQPVAIATTAEKSTRPQLNTLTSIDTNRLFSLIDVKHFSFSELATVCANFNLTLKAVSLKQKQQSLSTLAIYPLQLSISGDFYNIMDFIYFLEYYEKSIILQHMDMNHKSVNGQLLIVDMLLYLIGENQ